MDLQLETVHRLPLIQEMLPKFENLAQQKSIKLLTDAQNFELQGDPRRLRQILINLLGNALKFNHQGMINMRLTMRKHLVEQAFNGQQALDKVPAGNYDLVLMDMHMPVMDGHQATQRLRAN